MRLAAVLGAICALTQTASAEINDCSAMTDAPSKLACYNNEPPRTARSAPSAVRRPAARPLASTSDNPKGIDRPTDEDAAVDAKVRSLCRGC